MKRFPPDAEGRSLIFRYADLKARLLMNDLGKRASDEENWEGADLLLRAELYLSDRLAWEVDRAGVMGNHRRKVMAELRREQRP